MQSVKEALTAAGCSDINVDFDAKLAHVGKLDESKYTAEKAIAAVAEAGFSAQVVEGTN